MWRLLGDSFTKGQHLDYKGEVTKLRGGVLKKKGTLTIEIKLRKTGNLTKEE